MRVLLRAQTDEHGIVTVIGLDIDNEDAPLPPIRWPSGFTGLPGPPAQIISDTGEMVAQEGDTIEFEGWAVVEGVFGVCLIDGVYYPGG